MIEGLRRHSAAPILIDNLPEPTVQPLGMAERGLNGHRNRFRARQRGPGRPGGALSGRPCGRRRRRPGRRGLRAAAGRRPGGLHPFRLARLDAAAARRASAPPCTTSFPTPRPWPSWSAAIPTRRESGDGRARTSTPCTVVIGARPQEVRDRRPGRHAVARRAGRDRRALRLDAGDQRPLLLRRPLLRPARGAAGAEAARRAAGLRQQERRGHGARALALSATTIRTSGC